jgi:hypothetical protein
MLARLGGRRNVLVSRTSGLAQEEIDGKNDVLKLLLGLLGHLCRATHKIHNRLDRVRHFLGCQG